MLIIEGYNNQSVFVGHVSIMYFDFSTKNYINQFVGKIRYVI